MTISHQDEDYARQYRATKHERLTEDPKCEDLVISSLFLFLQLQMVVEKRIHYDVVVNLSNDGHYPYADPWHVPYVGETNLDKVKSTKK